MTALFGTALSILPSIVHLLEGVTGTCRLARSKSEKWAHSEKATMDRYDRAPAEFDERLLEALVPMHEAIPELADVAGEKLRDEFEGEWPFRAEKSL